MARCELCWAATHEAKDCPQQLRFEHTWSPSYRASKSRYKPYLIDVIYSHASDSQVKCTENLTIKVVATHIADMLTRACYVEAHILNHSACIHAGKVLRQSQHYVVQTNHTDALLYWRTLTHV